jgi:hypothetical protein
VSKDFRAFRQQLSGMKKDLDYVHRSLTSIKQKLANQHPVEFAQAKSEYPLQVPDDDSDVEEAEPDSTKHRPIRDHKTDQ